MTNQEAFEAVQLVLGAVSLDGVDADFILAEELLGLLRKQSYLLRRQRVWLLFNPAAPQWTASRWKEHFRGTT